jgi:hypothetical protein
MGLEKRRHLFTKQALRIELCLIRRSLTADNIFGRADKQPERSRNQGESASKSISDQPAHRPSISLLINSDAQPARIHHLSPSVSP